MESWNLFYPIKIAKRYNNNKRSYLLVNQIQGKHIPVRPGEPLALFKKLGEQIHCKYPNAKFVIGFSETATAIGSGVAEAIGSHCIYVTTTREPADEGIPYIFFLEEHSHAEEQKLCVKDFNKLLSYTDELVLIDDEISTGKTLLNIIESLRRQYPELCDRKIIVGSILNRLTKERLKQFSDLNIFFESIYNIDVEDDSLIREGTNLIPPSEEFYRSDRVVSDVRRAVIVNSRVPLGVGDHLRSCKALADQIMADINFEQYTNILVMGTEECMYPSIYTAKMIEEHYNVKAFCHSTTRSPIYVGTDTEYPIRNGYIIPSFYDNERINYIYNLATYDAAVVISDSTIAGAALSSLDLIFDKYNIKDKFYYLGGNNVQHLS